MNDLRQAEDELNDRVKSLEQRLADALNLQNDYEREKQNLQNQMDNLRDQNQKLKDQLDDIRHENEKVGHFSKSYMNL